MQHLAKINKMLDQGERDSAKFALDDLLLLGPNNLEGLKLKALIFSSEGRFQEEAQVWQRIFEVDPNDTDAFDFLRQKHLEDQEHFYFTDDLPNDGRRYLAYPKTLINISILGVMGCITFLFLTSFERFQITSYALFVSFLILVVSPWVGIIYVYCRSLRSVTVTKSSLTISTRFKTFKYDWKAVKKLCLSHSLNPNHPDLNLVIIPHDSYAKSIMIDFNEESSAIRARSFLVMDLGHFYDGFSFELWDDLEAQIGQIVYL